MNLYTEEDLQKRAWIADSIQADIMIDAIEASYKGDTDLFHCLMNKVANLHWLSESLKKNCYIGNDFNPNDFDPNDFN